MRRRARPARIVHTLRQELFIRAGAGPLPDGDPFPDMEPLVLTVDLAGLPQAWVDLEEAITYHAKQMVAWSVGGVVKEFRGGWQRNGTRSRISTKSILAIKGSAGRPLSHAPGLTNAMLFARDRHVCAYCGGRFQSRDLSRDHVRPVSRGGRDSWTNSVSACRSCNTRKGNRSPEQANMPLLYVPYVPNRHEHFILRNRRILADQMEYLLAGVPRTSRLHVPAGSA
jgi:5-methylcytosine-specific restriction endonuclease McrA